VNNDHIWTKEYMMLMVANFFVYFNFYTLTATAASFTISNLGVAEAKAGFGVGVFVIGALISRTFFSRYIKQRSFKKVLIFVIGALIVFTALLFTVDNFIIYCIVRFLGGMTFGINSNVLMTMVAYAIPPARKGEGVGWFSMSQILALALGPFFGVYIMHRYGFSEVFLLATMVAIASLVLVGLVKQPEDMEAETPDNSAGISQEPAIPSNEGGIWRFFEQKAINIAILCTLLNICLNTFTAFAAIFVSGSGAVTLSSVIFLVCAGSTFVARPFVGKLFDIHGPTMLLVFGFIIYSAGFFLISLGIIQIFLLSAALIGIGNSFLQGTALTLVVSNAPKHRLPVATATYFFSLDFGAAIGPAIGGSIAELGGYGVMYTVCAVVAIACLPLYFGVLARKRKQ